MTCSKTTGTTSTLAYAAWNLTLVTILTLANAGCREETPRSEPAPGVPTTQKTPATPERLAPLPDSEANTDSDLKPEPYRFPRPSFTPGPDEPDPKFQVQSPQGAALPLELPDAEKLAADGLASMTVGPFMVVSNLAADDLTKAASPLTELTTVVDRAFGSSFAGHTGSPEFLGFLIDEKKPFEGFEIPGIGLIAQGHGLQQGRRFWVRKQDDEASTQHLLVHEATHALMMHLSSAQPARAAWFHEGMAETLPIVARGEQAQPRIDAHLKSIRPSKDRPAPHVPLNVVLNYSEVDFVRDKSAYAYAWALCRFLALHPRWSETFKACMLSRDWNTVPAKLSQPLLNDRFAELEWAACLADLDVDAEGLPLILDSDAISKLTAESVSLAPAKRLTWVPARTSDRGPTSLAIHVDNRVTLTMADHSFEVTPAGATVDYRHGHPVGAVIAVVVPLDRPLNGNVFFRPTLIGADAKITLPPNSFLLLSINQPPQAQPAAGSFEVKID